MAFKSKPLVTAAKLGYTAIVESLLDNGIKVNALAGQHARNMALPEAVSRQRLHVVGLLLDAGADPKLPI